MTRDRPGPALALVLSALREPLLHFVVTGALLFGAYAWLAPAARNGEAAPARQVRIGEGEVKWLVETWSRQWRREPTPEELRGLVRDLLKEELLAREAREMRLDEGDTVVRRRLAQKMEFLVQDTARLAEPTEAELRALYEARPERFAGAARVSLTHVYFSPQLRKDAATDARRALPMLAGAKAVDPAALGDPSLLEPELRDADESGIAAVFGPAFAAEVMALAPGAWHGPIASSYGVHLVRVSDRADGRPRALDEVRGGVADLWREERRREIESSYLRRLMEKYDVVIDGPARSILGDMQLTNAR